jgi:CopG family nickel-responsive transcriptional regulator
MAIVSMSLSDEMLRRFDAAAKGKGYAKRSEAFREALADFIAGTEWDLASGTNTVILAVIHEKERSRGSLPALQHKYEEIRTMLHTHLDEVNCLEIFVAKGEAGRLKALTDQVRKLRGVKQVKFLPAAYNL